MRIEGHTDDTPIRTSRFRSNWELSTARATQVIAYLQNDLGPAGVAPLGGRLRRVPSARAEHVAGRRGRENRRVDLVILNAATSAAEEPTARRRRADARRVAAA